MKKLLFSLLLIAWACTSASADGTLRQIININRDWKFKLAPSILQRGQFP